nr:hypothetical protein OG461_21580 [Streptomyces sp. NBC_00995]
MGENARPDWFKHYATRAEESRSPEARGGVKAEVRWDGYKVHVTETCDPGMVHLITNVPTTVATVTDDQMATVVHAGLAERDLLPGEHWVDTGCANAGAVVAARRDHGVALHGPMRPRTAPHARTAYAHDAFAIDGDNQRVTCPPRGGQHPVAQHFAPPHSDGAKQTGPD